MDALLFAVGAMGAGVMCFLCGVILSEDVKALVAKWTFRAPIR